MLCWADKVGLLWAFLVVGFLLLIGSNRAAILAPEAIWELALVTVPVWIGFRLIDWIAGGPARRRGQVRARVIR